MFHFGLFSTFIPYLIIAAIYFCGLASYSIDRINKHIEDKHDNTYYYGEYDISLNTDLHLLNIDTNSFTHSNILVTDKEYLYTTYTDSVFWFLQKPDFKKSIYSFSIFSRPPPYLL